MNLSFKAFALKGWTLLDDKVIVGNKEILLSSLTRATHDPSTSGKNGVIQIFYGSGAFDFKTLAYPKKQKADGEKAAAYIFAVLRGEDPNESVKERDRIQREGYRKICNSCGHIYYFTQGDLEENEKRRKRALTSSIAGLGGAVGGYYGASAMNTHSAQDQLDKIIDYGRCPKCGSSNVSDATDEDIERAKNINNNINNVAQQLSAADELKKFKELLDSGIITQEEFDTKKKQLLGL